MESGLLSLGAKPMIVLTISICTRKLLSIAVIPHTVHNHNSCHAVSGLAVYVC